MSGGDILIKGKKVKALLFLMLACLVYPLDKLAKVIPEMTRNVDGSQNVVGSIISLAILLMVGVLILGQFQVQTDDQMATGDIANDTVAQAAYDNVKSSSWGAMNLMGMYPWILGAVAILSVVVLIGNRQ